MHRAKEVNVMKVFKIDKSLRAFAAALLSGVLLVSSVLLAGCASHTVSNITIAGATAAADGTEVVVTGEVVQQVDRGHLLLRDSSGQINVTVDEDILGKVKFAPDSRLRVLGKVDRNSERSVLIAKSVQVVQ
ncbi:MAG TPA: NirD/YgiW/YdeI family stress tolerance protein [Spongiibacteraceae bacterium]|nr:NirD/YgiW/YdeI family stress tolerance protein [Spongiibacteraceae bacterium]